MGDEEFSEELMDWDEPLVVIGKPEEGIVSDDMADADELMSNLPTVIVDKGDGDKDQGIVFAYTHLRCCDNRRAL